MDRRNRQQGQKKKQGIKHQDMLLAYFNLKIRIKPKRTTREKEEDSQENKTYKFQRKETTISDCFKKNAEMT
eukprot:5516170-Ditylum_brightwellii.AAC.2